MPLKDRIKSKKTENLPERTNDCSFINEKKSVEFKVSVEKLTERILSVKDNANLGAIVKEIAKFLGSLSENNAEIVLKGNFDIGKKALIACLLSNISEESSKPVAAEICDGTVKKRKTLKEKIRSAKTRAMEDED